MSAARLVLCGAVLAAAGLVSAAGYVDTSHATGGSMFNPSATLDSSQVQDRRGEPRPPNADQLAGWFCASYETPAGIGWVCVPPKTGV